MVDRIKKFLKNTKRIWPKLDLRVSAKSGKVNFEKCDYIRSRSEIFKIVSNSLKITTSLRAYWSFIFKWFGLSEINRPDWIIKIMVLLGLKVNGGVRVCHMDIRKGFHEFLENFFFKVDKCISTFFFKHSFLNFFSETSKSTCFEVRKHSKTFLDETTQRRLLLKKKWKVFFPVEKAKKVTQSEKQSQSQHFFT